MRRVIFGRVKNIIKILARASSKMYINISTRSGDYIVTKQEGATPYNFTPVKNKDYTLDRTGLLTDTISYTSSYLGDIKIKLLKGVSDVYSIWIGYIDKNIENNNDRYSINVKSFFQQFTNLYSIYINEKAPKNDSVVSIIVGDFSDLPTSVERVLIDGLEVRGAYSGFEDGTLFLNISNYSSLSKLKFFRKTDLNAKLKVLGNLYYLPPLLNHLSIKGLKDDSIISYTSGKVWASAFDTFDIGVDLYEDKVDSAFIDMQNSITTAINNKLIVFERYRTPTSDAAVLYLQSLGFTVNCRRIDKTVLLNLDATNSTSYVGSGTTIYDLSGNSNNGTLLNGVGYNPANGGSLYFDGLDDRVSIPDKPQLRELNGSISVWFKVTDIIGGAGFGGVVNKAKTNSREGFSILTTKTSLYISIYEVSVGYKLTYNVNTMQWLNVTLTWREGKVWSLYVNGIFINKLTTTNVVNIANQPIYIGQTLDSFWGKFKGNVGQVIMYNYYMKDSEVLANFNLKKSNYGL